MFQNNNDRLDGLSVRGDAPLASAPGEGGFPRRGRQLHHKQRPGKRPKVRRRQDRRRRPRRLRKQRPAVVTQKQRQRWWRPLLWKKLTLR